MGQTKKAVELTQKLTVTQRNFLRKKIEALYNHVIAQVQSYLNEERQTPRVLDVYTALMLMGARPNIAKLGYLLSRKMFDCAVDTRQGKTKDTISVADILRDNKNAPKLVIDRRAAAKLRSVSCHSGVNKWSGFYCNSQARASVAPLPGFCNAGYRDLLEAFDQDDLDRAHEYVSLVAKTATARIEFCAETAKELETMYEKIEAALMLGEHSDGAAGILQRFTDRTAELIGTLKSALSSQEFSIPEPPR